MKSGLLAGSDMFWKIPRLMDDYISLIDEHANSVRWMCQTRNAVDDLMLECRRQGFGAGFKAAMELLADISEEDRREKSEDGGETV